MVSNLIYSTFLVQEETSEYYFTELKKKPDKLENTLHLADFILLLQATHD